MQIVALTGSQKKLSFTPMEEKILSLLKERPLSLDELVIKTGVYTDKTLALDRLEENFLIQRCGLTPTDLLHIRGDFQRWDTAAGEKLLAVMAAVSGYEPQALVDRILGQVTEELAQELIKKQLSGTVAADDLNDCATCKALLKQMLAPNNGGPFAIRFQIRQPVVGIGAPTGHFLPRAATLLGTEAILPDHMEVANAVGAITSPVIVTIEVQIKPDPRGGFAVQGLAGDHRFPSLEEAQAYAQKVLGTQARALARQAGTDADAVRLVSDDKVARTASGFDLFISRKVAAHIVGVPLPGLLKGETSCAPGPIGAVN
jgi:N-methylhydantoinase A/oxoprolinase/acetone carboxylase beta subunit